MRPLRVLVVDDSALARDMLRELLTRDGDIEVVAEAPDGGAAVRLVDELGPDLVTMDLQLPGLSGLDAIEQIMARRPVPILVVTGQPSGEGNDLAFQAVQRGALHLLPKPSLAAADAGAQLRAEIRALARVPVLRHVAGARAAAPAPA
ncbi:MAG TPA: response regulator, partial [Polyangia bacterium]